ncbi:MAG TPA: 2-oxoacid:acceptor oxidoreductase subunit alpha [Desulfatiglandales bacterium]|nr:2-oxoacid:acceptor oxidoreductase subunit alpha [Desulfatiglandales bacterium]
MNDNLKCKDKRVNTGIHFMLGNYAVVEGALAGGCDYFAGYPITPANEISELMSKRLPEVGGIFVQGEDELFSIYSVVSASLAGAKAMTATASAGFNYMQEGIGYASAVEAPCVIVDVQRCRGENFATQADVMQMRWGASGDYESIVLAPSTAQELFDFTILAFNLAEEFRNPVIVMSETTIALMRERVEIPEKERIINIQRQYTSLPPEMYLPFKAKANCPPEFAPMGKGYHTLYTLNYHNEDGTIDWNDQGYKKLYQRITGKISENRDKICKAESYFLEDADSVIITYGSEVRPALDAVEMARNNGKKIGLLKLITVWPVHENLIKDIAKNVGRVFVVEMNIGKYVKEIERLCLPFCPVTSITKNMGIIHTKDEIYSAIKEVL